MKNILLPTDFSENAWNAIDYALHFFKYDLCNFYLLHIHQISGLVNEHSNFNISNSEIEKEYSQPAKKAFKKIKNRIARKFSKNNYHRFFNLEDYGFFTESLKKYVKLKEIDLIVMGTKGASGFKKMTIGSNTANVIKKVPCNTFVIPENARFKKIEEIAFPTDLLSSYNYFILDNISQILEDHLASLHIIHVKKKEEKLNKDQEKNLELLKDFFEDQPFSIHYFVNNDLEETIQNFVESRNIDIIVMVAKHLNYFQQILFHTKIEKISYHTNIPFLILHE
jgi:nucleotide-binding universal stress UspA family protein